MNEIFLNVWDHYLDIIFVIFRLLGVFLLVPVFSHKSVPVMARILLALSMSIAIYPVVKAQLPVLPETIGGYFAIVLRESIYGFLMGFIVYLTFEAINLAAQFVGYQIGFGVAGLMDPQNGAQVSVLVPLHGWLALMIFLLADLHHEIIILFVRSYEVTGNLNTSPGSPLFTFVVQKVGDLFAIAVQMAAPFTLLVLSTNVAIGVLARMLPQMNILLFSFPITILVGISALYIVAPDMIVFLNNLLGRVSGDLMLLMKEM